VLPLRFLSPAAETFPRLSRSPNGIRTRVSLERLSRADSVTWTGTRPGPLTLWIQFPVDSGPYPSILDVMRPPYPLVADDGRED